MMQCERLNTNVGFCDGKCKVCTIKSNKYELHMSIDMSSKIAEKNDEWRFKTVEALSEEDAKGLVIAEYKDKGYTVNYFLCCTQLN